MKITEAELLARKNRIIREAFHLFCQNGIDGVSIKDIACKADVSEKSVYRYFNNKVELIQATVTVMWQEIIAKLTDSIDPGFEAMTGLARIACLLRCFRNLFENHSCYILFSYDSKLFLIRHGAHLSEQLYRDEIQPMQDLHMQALQKGVQDGSVNICADAEDVFYAIWGLLRGYIVKIVLGDRMSAAENMWLHRYDLACDLILKGLKNST